uniref:Uncharacterized protein n=1 Tax=Glossina palpalis gambiensis TaxID=67801 RepID=A0A1B0ATC6_9MUSC
MVRVAKPNSLARNSIVPTFGYGSKAKAKRNASFCSSEKRTRCFLFGVGPLTELPTEPGPGLLFRMAFGVCGECIGIIIGFFSPLGPDAVVGTLELGFVVAAGGRMVLLSGLGAAEFAFRAGVLAEGCEAGVLLPVSDLHIPGYNRSTLGVELSLAFVVFCWATVLEFSKEVCEEVKELRCPFVLSSLTAVSLPKLRSCAPFSICCCKAIKLEKLGKFGGCACCCNLTISLSKANRILSSAAKPLNVLPGIPAAADQKIPNFSSSTKPHLIYEQYAHQTCYRHGHRTAI